MKRRQTLTRQRLVLADDMYEDCLFEDCELVFDGRPIHYVRNRVKDCRITLIGPANNTMQFLSAMGIVNGGSGPTAAIH